MEISKHNFESSLPFIREALIDADFISIDAEFSGLQPPNVGMLVTDDLSQRYSKLLKCVQEFTIVQYGVCAFKKNEKGEFVAKPFNFYIFGNDTDSVQSRRVFTSQASSLAFLRSNKFDFNKLIDDGIPFYNFSEESTFVSSIQGTTMMSRKTLIPESSLTNSGRSFLQYNRNSIEKWLQGDTEKPLVVQVNSLFFRKLIYQEISEKYSGILVASQRDSRHLQITRLKENERREREKSVKSPTLNFRAVIELIKEAECPVVAHNATLDIFHTVDQFWEYLPKSIEEGKQTINSMWDNIVDTKYMAQFHPDLKTCFDSTVLGSLYNTVTEELNTTGKSVTMADGFDRYTQEDNQKEHEAGYDAYMTGVIYIAFIMFINQKKLETAEAKKQIEQSTPKAMEEDKKEDESEEESEEEEESSEEEESEEEGEVSDDDDSEDRAPESSNMFLSKDLRSYYGRLFLMRSEIPYINLKGNEEVIIPILPNKFFLRNIPEGMTNVGLEKLYPTIQPAAVSWINGHSAWISLKDDSKIPLVRLGLLGMSTVQSFLRGASREVEGVAHGINKDASRMELLSHERWAEIYGPQRTVNYNSMASIMADMKGDDVPSGAPSFEEPEVSTAPKRQREDEDQEETPTKIPRNNK
ncbi:CAF1 family ribonuclease-domain-containing protein [Sporodiniella umbellata]|nr:CAF1 family ribonuclease-domain-containing protein [Sporodiniella umbellata]